MVVGERVAPPQQRACRMCRTTSESASLQPPREKVRLRCRSRSLSVRFAETGDGGGGSAGGGGGGGGGGGSGSSRRSCSSLVPPQHRVSPVRAASCSTVEEETPLPSRQPVQPVGSSGSGRRRCTWSRGRRGSPPPQTKLTSAAYSHSSLELCPDEGSEERRESRVRALLRGVGSLLRSGKRKLLTPSVSVCVCVCVCVCTRSPRRQHRQDPAG